MENFDKKLYHLENEIINAIKNVIYFKGNKNDTPYEELLIPYYYDEDNITNEIEELIEEGYNVKEGNEYDNLTIDIVNYSGYKLNVSVVALMINTDDEVELITADRESYRISDIVNTRQLINLYEFVFNLK